MPELGCAAAQVATEFVLRVAKSSLLLAKEELSFSLEAVLRARRSAARFRRASWQQGYRQNAMDLPIGGCARATCSSDRVLPKSGPYAQDHTTCVRSRL